MTRFHVLATLLLIGSCAAGRVARQTHMEHSAMDHGAMDHSAMDHGAMDHDHDESGHSSPDDEIRTGRLDLTVPATLLEEEGSEWPEPSPESESEPPFDFYGKYELSTDEKINSMTFTEVGSSVHYQFQNFSSCYDVSFDFKTDQPHGLLLKMGYDDSTTSVFLHNGFLKVRVSSATKRQTFEHPTGGLEDNQFHTVRVSRRCDDSDFDTLSVSLRKLSAFEDNQGETKFEVEKSQVRAEKLNIYLGAPSTDLPSAESTQFHGCMKDITVKDIDSPEHTAVHTTTPHHQDHITAQCLDACRASVGPPCPLSDRCVNHFTHFECECMSQCGDDDKEAKELFLFGDGYLSHDLYPWNLPTHTTRINIQLDIKTNTKSSLLVAFEEENPDGRFFRLVISDEGELLMQGDLSSPDASRKTSLSMDNDSPSHFVSDGEWHSVVLTLEFIRETRLKPQIFFGNSLYPESDYSCEGAACPWTIDLPYLGHMRNVFVNGKDVIDNIGSDGNIYVGKTAEQSYPDENVRLSLQTEQSSFDLADDDYLSETPYTGTLHIDFFSRNPKGSNDGKKYILVQGKFTKVGNGEFSGTWTVYQQGHHMFYHQDIYNITLESATDVNFYGWNRLELSQPDGVVSLKLNDMEAQSTESAFDKFHSEFTIGSASPDAASLVSCVQNVRINSVEQELRRFARLPGLALNSCEDGGAICNSQTCQNGGKCVGSLHKMCDCDSTVYTGNRCQFRKYYASCEEYYRHGFNVSGSYLLHLEDTEEAKLFQCDFKKDYSEMTMEHAIPENYVVRSSVIRDHRTYVDYEGITAPQMKNIAQAADRCRQTIKFSCRNARLGIGILTNFKSDGKEFSNYPGVCPCGLRGDCDDPQERCNCDVNDGLEHTDEATLMDKRALPVTSLIFRRTYDTVVDTKQLLTLGKFVCGKKNTPEDAVSFLNCHSPLELPHDLQKNIKLYSFRFGFRTIAASGLILHKAGSTSQHADVSIMLKSANELQVTYRHERHEESVTFEDVSPINVGRWHHVTVEFSASEIAVTFNGKKQFLPIEHSPIIEGDIYLGATPKDNLGSYYESLGGKGLVGCIRNLFVNGEQISLASLEATSAPGKRRSGCQLLCDPNPCGNGGKCREEEGGKGFHCTCSNTFAHRGRDCQHDVNKNVVTLLDRRTALRYKKARNLFSPDSDTNPLKHDITIGFRTRDLQALLMYAEDSIGNLAQLYMSSPFTLTLLWNHADGIRELSVETNGLALNLGQFVQVHVRRTTEIVTLTVVVEGSHFIKTFEGAPVLKDLSSYDRVSFKKLIPHPDLTLQGSRMSRERGRFTGGRFTLVVGAVDIDGLVPKVPGLMGCLSGFVVGEVPYKLDDTSEWDYHGKMVDMGCHTACKDHNPCQNGGRCLNVMGHATRRAECLCEGTSYAGLRCDQENVFHNNGTEETSVVVLGPRFLPGEYLIDFAFALGEKERSEETSEMIFQYSNVFSGDVMSAFIVGGSKFVYSYQVEGTRFAGVADLSSYNIADGQRHHIKLDIKQMQLWIDNSEMYLTVDHSYYIFEDDYNSGDDQETAFVVGRGFDGCISNLRVGTGSASVFEPLAAAPSNATGVVKGGTCGAPAFLMSGKGVPMAIYEPRVEYLDSHSPNLGASTAEKSDKMSTALKVGLFIIATCAIGMMYYLFQINKKYKIRKQEGLNMTKLIPDGGTEELSKLGKANDR